MTPSSSDLRRPLISIVEQICRIFQLRFPSNFDDLKKSLEETLKQIPEDERVFILLDSIDQLEKNDIEHLEDFLPTEIPSRNVKILFSTIPEIEIDRKQIKIREKLRSIYSKRNLFEIEVEPFRSDLSMKVFRSWLEKDRRRLTTKQIESIEQILSRTNQITALFLSLIYDQTLNWRSTDEQIDQKFLSIRTTSNAIAHLYEKMTEKHGELLFKRSMRYLQNSGGLTEIELQDILSSDDDILKSVFEHYLPPFEIFRLPPALWIRIHNDMEKYFVEKLIDGAPCITL